jgi:polyisoprenoid-binding protein YceI
MAAKIAPPSGHGLGRLLCRHSRPVMARLFLMFILLLPAGLRAQVLVCNNGTVSFYSQKLNITGDCRAASGKLDTFSGEAEVSVPMEAFEFKHAFMQRRFMRKRALFTEKHPFATFKGSVTGFKGRELKKNDRFDATVSGQLTIKGVAVDISQKATVEVKEGMVTVTTEFVIDRHRFGIKSYNWWVSHELETTLRMRFL